MCSTAVRPGHISYSPVSLDIDGQVRFVIGPGGKIEQITIVTSTLSDTVDNRLIDAVRRLDSSQILAAFAPTSGSDPIAVRFTITERSRSAGQAMPFFVMRRPTWILRSPARANPRNNPPQYPPNARAAKVNGSVFASFVVGVDGLPLMETLRFTQITHRDVAAAVYEALPQMRLYPARIGDCAVPQRVSMPFVFSVR